MTPDKILEVVGLYETMLQRHGDAPARIGPDSISQSDVRRYSTKRAHLLTMPPRIREFVAAGRTEKAFRWLGFIQGALWADGYYSVDELAEHNRPADQT